MKMKRKLLLQQRKQKGLLQFGKNSKEEYISVPLTSHEQAKKEVTAYSELTAEDTRTEPLDWWKQNSDRFPLLSTLVKKYLCVCGTSLPSVALVDTLWIPIVLVLDYCEHVNFWQKYEVIFLKLMVCVL